MSADNVIGRAVDRKDGRPKVTGRATFAAEHDIKDMLHGYVVTSTIAKGRITKIDTAAAEKAPGVVSVITRANRPKLFKPVNDWQTNAIIDSRFPLEDDVIFHSGQIVAMVVADSFERARHAASLVAVEYQAETPVLSIAEGRKQKAPPAPQDYGAPPDDENYKRGDADAALASAAAKVEAVYATAMETHAPMEPHAIIAHWEGDDRLTIYEPSQWVRGAHSAYAQIFGLPEERVRLVSPYVGGGFGSKALPWPHAILAVAAARKVGRPVKLVLSRRQMFPNVGHRPETENAITIGADRDGTIVAIKSDGTSHIGQTAVFVEEVANCPQFFYASPNVTTVQRAVRVNLGLPTFMRAPGETTGMWGLESAMDELAYALGMDPIALRLKNHTDADQRRKVPYSAKHLRECYEMGAAKFGWSQRTAKPRSMQKDGRLIGWGMASATFPGIRLPARAKARINADGTAVVSSATHELGTGAYTVFAQAAAHSLGLPIEKVRFELGESSMPNAPVAGGSMSTASVAPAVLEACKAAALKAGQMALRDPKSPLTGAKPDDLAVEGVKVSLKSDPSKSETVFDILNRRGMAAVDAEAGSAPGEEQRKFAFQSWGAHFCEVTVDEDLCRARVTRWVAAMDIGTVMNAKTAASQVRGSVVMGIGEALMEETVPDPGTGRLVVYDLATYHVATHADVPHIDVEFVNKPDTVFNPFGCRGVGEIGITGVAPAIANAIYHATGKRLRTLPITPDKLV
jgi:xanthine dehydrogenase YagR molybdenum-binding subunit